MEEDILKFLIETNPWWQEDEVPEKFLGMERKNYLEKIKEKLERKKILALVGLRRSGKTTLIYQMISQFLKERISAKNILYFNIENFEDLKIKGNSIKKILEIYQEFQEKDLKKEEVFVFIDEIHHLKGWQFYLKHFYDLKYPLRFIISGSSYSLIYKDSSESLLGRISFVNISPLSFSEFLEFFEIPIDPFSFSENFNFYKKQYFKLLPKEAKIKNFLKKYFLVGGFPEYFEIKDKKSWFSVLREEYLSLLLYRDIIKIFKVRDPFLLENLAKFLAKHSTQRFSYLKMANYLDADKETLKLYLYYLTSSGICTLSNFFTKSGKVSEKKEKKIYFTDNGLKNAFLMEENLGFLAENLFFNHLKSQSQSFFSSLFYWSNQKKEELDIVLKKENKIIPFEIKFKDDIKKGELKGLCDFMKKFKIKKGFVITKDLFRKEKEILYLPLWMSLLLKFD